MFGGNCRPDLVPDFILDRMPGPVMLPGMSLIMIKLAMPLMALVVGFAFVSAPMPMGVEKGMVPEARIEAIPMEVRPVPAAEDAEDAEEAEEAEEAGDEELPTRTELEQE
jgi:hypothetical protein